MNDADSPFSKLKQVDDAIKDHLATIQAYKAAMQDKAAKKKQLKEDSVKTTIVDSNIDDLIGDMMSDCIWAIAYIGEENSPDRCAEADERVRYAFDLFRDKLREYLLRRDRVATELCRIYFEIAAEAIGEDEVRKIRGDKLRKRRDDRKAIDQSMRNL